MNDQVNVTQYFYKHRAIAVASILVGLLIFTWLWGLSASIRGNLAARIDIHRGRYQVLGYGLPSPSRPEYARCLRDRYGIEFRAVAGCIVSRCNVCDSIPDSPSL